MAQSSAMPSIAPEVQAFINTPRRMLIDGSWHDTFRANFRGLGSPESLNEANQRRFSEILAERGRLYKNSDDFPWVILQD